MEAYEAFEDVLEAMDEADEREAIVGFITCAETWLQAAERDNGDKLRDNMGKVLDRRHLRYDSDKINALLEAQMLVEALSALAFGMTEEGEAYCKPALSAVAKALCESVAACVGKGYVDPAEMAELLQK